MTDIRCTVIGPGGVGANLSLQESENLQGLDTSIRATLKLPARPRFLDYSGRVLSPVVSLARNGLRDGARIVVVDEADESLGEEGFDNYYRVLPTYLVIDTSGSMRGEPIDRINAELKDLLPRMRREPAVAEVCQLSVVSFDADAKTRLPLTEIMDVTAPDLVAEGTVTNFTNVFAMLRRQIGEDLYRLSVQGFQPYRPVVFFLTDGRPNQDVDTWKQALKDLLPGSGFVFAPHVVSFGYGNASRSIIEQVGVTEAYIAETHTPTAQFATLMRFFMNSLMTSVMDPDKGSDPHDIYASPSRAPKGWTPLKVDTE